MGYIRQSWILCNDENYLMLRWISRMCTSRISRAISTLWICRILSVFMHYYVFFAKLCCCPHHCDMCFGPLGPISVCGHKGENIPPYSMDT